MRVSIGRIVHYRTHEGQAEPYAAIVTKVWGDACVNLTIFRDDGTTQLESSVLRYDNVTGGRQWCWPPHVE